MTVSSQNSWNAYCTSSVLIDCTVVHAKGGQVAVQCLQGRSIDGVPASHNPVLQEVLDLRPYINSSAAAVQESFSLDRTYVVFRTLGLRHLVVVDRHNHVKGIVTRKVQGSACACTAQPHEMTWQLGMSAGNSDLMSTVQIWCKTMTQIVFKVIHYANNKSSFTLPCCRTCWVSGLMRQSKKKRGLQAVWSPCQDPLRLRS